MEDKNIFGETDGIDILVPGRETSESAAKPTADSEMPFDPEQIDRELEENGKLTRPHKVPSDGAPAMPGEHRRTAVRRPTAARRPSDLSVNRNKPADRTRVIPDTSSVIIAEGAAERTRVITPAEGKRLNAAAKVPSKAVKSPVMSASKAPEKEIAKSVKSVKPAKKQPENQDSEPEKKVEIRDKGGIFSTFSKTIVYIAVVIGVSVLISIIGIKFANDCFAFVKDDYETTVVINSGATVSEVADVLESSGVISQPLAFKLYVGYKYRKNGIEFAEGIYTLNANMNYDQIIYDIRAGKAGKREIVKLTFPEGSTVDDVINTLLENKIGTREGYLDAINNYDYDYPFISDLEKNGLPDGRKYRLEGYLYPDTYEFYTDSTEVAVIDKFLYNFSTIFGDAELARCKELKYSMDEVITIASIVQKESKYASEFYTTASVFYNRLKSSDFPKFESDATVQYCLEEHVEHITAELRNTDSPYNTYLYNGLTPSAICNPGIDAITAALYPEDTDYYFFYAGKDGYNIFSKTYSEHLKVQEKVAAGEE